jgi:hypothetical protein
MIEDIMHIPRGGFWVVDDAQLFFNSMRILKKRIKLMGRQIRILMKNHLRISGRLP